MAATRRRLVTCKSEGVHVHCNTAADIPSLVATHVAAINAILASVNPATAQDKALSRNLQKALDTAGSVDAASADVRRALFGSTTKAFDRIREAGKGAQLDLDVSSLKSILFGPNVDIEALRLLRADALLAIKKSSPSLLSSMKNELAEIRRQEVSRNVLERLENATSE